MTDDSRDYYELDDPDAPEPTDLLRIEREQIGTELYLAHGFFRNGMDGDGFRCLNNARHLYRRNAVIINAFYPNLGSDVRAAVQQYGEPIPMEKVRGAMVEGRTHA